MQLGEKAVLMRLTAALPGEQRQDPQLSAEVKNEHKLGAQSGRWIKSLYPPEALAGLKKLDNAARAYHAAVTLPFDQGIGILPAALIFEYGDKMREFKSKRQVLIDQFLDGAEKWVQWAVANHNGTFDPEQYPGVQVIDYGNCGKRYEVDVAQFKGEMAKRFNFETQPIPVPETCHFSKTVSSLLGVDAAGVDERVRDAEAEAQREVMRRLIEPVSAMAKKLAEAPKVGKGGKEKADIVFRDSLVGNLAEIAKLAPKLNLAGDPVIDAFCQEVDALTRYSPDTLRESKETRSEAQKKAADLLKRMEGYKL